MEATYIPSVAAARKVEIPAEAIQAIRKALREQDRDALASVRDTYGEIIYQLAKFRAIADSHI